MAAEQIVNGLALGAIYACFAMGFGIVFSTMKVLNLAQGVYATWGAIVAYWVVAGLGAPLALGCVVGALTGAAVAVFVDQVGFEPLRRRGAEMMLGAIITSVALWFALREVASLVTGAAPLGFPASSLPSWSINVAGLELHGMQVVQIGTALAVVVALHLFLQNSKVGTAIRAVGMDRQAAAIGGVNPQLAIIVGAALSGAVTGLAGALFGAAQVVSFNLGDGLLLTGFAAVVIGGIGDVRSSAFGGFFVGYVQVLSAEFISSALQDAIVFGLLLAFLLARPRGFFGKIDLVKV